MSQIKIQHTVFFVVCFVLQVINANPHMPAQPAYAPATPSSRGPGDVMLSQQELEELQAMEQLVEQERAKMTPAQRAEFDNTVAELTKELEKMQPEELDAFISQVIFGQDPNASPTEQPMPNQQYVPQPTMVHTEMQEEKTPSVDTQAQKREEVLAAINAILSTSRSFLDKINTAPAFGPTLKKWVDQKKIKNWKSSYSWETIKVQIEDLMNKLEEIKKQDDKTNQYIYLDQVIHDADLCNNLNKFSALLKEHEQTVEIDPLGYDAITKESKQALMAVINEYLEMFTVHNIVVALKNIIESHEFDGESQEASEFVSVRAPEIKAQPSLKQTKAPAPVAHSPLVSSKKEEPKEDDSAIARLINKLDGALEGAADNIKSSVLSSIKAHLADAHDPQPNCDAANNYLPNTIKKIKTATGNIKALKVNIQSLPAEEQKKQYEAIKSTCHKHKNTFDDIIKQTQWIKSHENVVSPEKKYAFLAGPSTGKTKDILYPSSLYDLQGALEEFEKQYKTL